MWLKTRIALGVIGVLICALVLVANFWAVPLIVTKKIHETVQLEDGQKSYDRWVELPIPIKYNIYFFNISNPAEVQSGGKPIVKEVGPFVYNQKRWKTNITKDGDELSYLQNLDFTFDEDASFPLTEWDELTVVNLPLMAVVAIAEKVFKPTHLTTLNNLMGKIFYSPKDMFLRTTPRDFLFDGIFLGCDKGFVSLICSQIEKYAPPTLQRLADRRFKFSLLSHKNSTDYEGNFVINSGTEDFDLLGQISSWRGSPKVNTWGPNGTCNDIVGSDSTIYPPFQTPESVLSVFSTDICRSVALEYAQDIEYSGISGYRYTSGKKMLASPSNFSDNECFCLGETTGIRGEDECLLDGALELWSCQEAPVVLTLPHFHLAHDAYKNGVDGLTPDSELHEMYVDLEPNTGTPLRGHKRAQFNIFFRKINKIDLTANLTTTLMPIVWLDEGVDLPDDLVEELNEELFDVLNKIKILIWVLLGIGVLMIAATIVWSLVICYKRSHYIA